MLSELKGFSQNSRFDNEELVAMATFGRSLESEFGQLGVDVPGWLPVQLKALRREIKARNADALASKLASAKARRETLKSPDEKRAALEKEIADLEAKQAEA